MLGLDTLLIPSVLKPLSRRSLLRWLYQAVWSIFHGDPSDLSRSFPATSLFTSPLSARPSWTNPRELFRKLTSPPPPARQLKESQRIPGDQQLESDSAKLMVIPLVALEQSLDSFCESCYEGPCRGPTYTYIWRSWMTEHHRFHSEESDDPGEECESLTVTLTHERGTKGPIARGGLAIRR